MACASTCPTPGGHASYGECIRAKNVQIDKHSLKVGVPALERSKDRTLARFRECVKSGVTPAWPRTRQTTADRKTTPTGPRKRA